MSDLPARLCQPGRQAYTVMVPTPAPSAVVRASPGLVAPVGALRFTLSDVTPQFATYDLEGERGSAPLVCARCRLRTTQLYQNEHDELCRLCYEMWSRDRAAERTR